MSISYLEKFFLINMLTLDSNITMEGLDLAISDDVLHTKTSRTATFTLSSSSSSSLCSQLNEFTPRASFDDRISENRFLKHSQSLTLECQRRRPIIDDPYQVTPNLEILNDWMIVSLLLFKYVRNIFFIIIIYDEKLEQNEIDDRSDK
jgi:hypothetical protein